MRVGIWLRRLSIGAIAGLGLALVPAGASAGVVSTFTGTTTESSGLVSHYKIEVPSPWNGTLVLYSHGYNAPQTDVGDPATGAWLLDHGFALAGSTYATTGWALEQAFQDQIAVLDKFDTLGFGHPSRTIAWGHSLGGMITAGLIQLFPDRFTAALPMCGVVAGGPGVWNQGLDSEFALQTLMPTPGSKLVNFTSFTDAAINFNVASTALATAQTSPQGRARIALSAALADIPGWFDPTKPEPAPTDFPTQEQNQFLWDQSVDFFFAYLGRFELERRAGGNFSWNTGVDYRAQLANSADLAEVQGLYAAAGLDLNQDLDTINSAARISADPAAVDYLTRFIVYNGDNQIPVLTLHTTGDGLVDVTDESAYSSVVRSQGDGSNLRQVFVHRAGHCTFTPAETISAFQTLINRLDTGSWPSTSPDALNAQASALGLFFNIAPPSFISFQPAQFLRPFDIRNVENVG